MGVGGLRGSVRVQHAPVRPEEAVRDGRGAVHRVRGLHHRRDPSQHQSQAAEAAGGRSQVGAAARRDGERDGRREGRHRRRDHRDAFVREEEEEEKKNNITIIIIRRSSSIVEADEEVEEAVEISNTIARTRKG